MLKSWKRDGLSSDNLLKSILAVLYGFPNKKFGSIKNKFKKKYRKKERCIYINLV